LGFVAEEAKAETPAPSASGIKRTILQQMDGPMPGYVTVMVLAEIAADALVGRHTHPGVESAFVIEGGGVLSVQGQPEKTGKPGDVFQIPPEMPHSFKSGDKPTRLNVTLVVEKGKPLASPA
jgi:quercetin dioxygenase-like cupin family protein